MAVFDYASGSLLRTMGCESAAPCTGLCFVGALVYAACTDGGVHVYDPADGKWWMELGEPDTDAHTTVDIVATEAGTVAVSNSLADAVYVYDPVSGDKLSTWEPDATFAMLYEPRGMCVGGGQVVVVCDHASAIFMPERTGFFRPQTGVALWAAAYHRTVLDADAMCKYAMENCQYLPRMPCT